MDPPVKAERAVEYSFYINGQKTQNLAEKFRINKETGVITALKSLDREETAKYLASFSSKSYCRGFKENLSSCHVVIMFSGHLVLLNTVTVTVAMFLFIFIILVFCLLQVQVLARDDNGLESRRYLLIEVCDRDDNQPEFPSYPNGTVISYFFTIEEGKQ